MSGSAPPKTPITDALTTISAQMAQTKAALDAQIPLVKALETAAPPAPGQPSADGAKASDTATVIISDDGTSWRLTGSPGAYTIQFAPKGAPSTWAAAGNTAQVTSITKWKATCAQTSPNSSGLSQPGWWSGVMASPTAFGTWTAIPGDPSAATPQPPSGAFAVRDAQILGPDGKPWHGNGVNLAADPQGWGFTGCQAALADLANCNPLLAVFPHTKIVRIPCYDIGLCTPDYVRGYVQALTALSRVCSIEYHLTGMVCPTASTNPSLATVCAWYSSMSAAFAGNPYVWFEIPNEINPWLGNTADNFECIKQVVGAVRAHSNTIVQIAMLTGSTNVTPPGDPWWQQQRNLVMGCHAYQQKGYDGGFNGGNQAAADAWMASLVQRFAAYHTADGVLPLINGEYGDSTDGGNVDPDWQVVVTAGSKTGPSGLVAATAWFWNSRGPGGGLQDCLLAPPNYGASGLTPYGQIIHDLM